MQTDIYPSEMKEIWQSEISHHLFPERLIVEIGGFFLGAPYQSATLESSGKEKLVLNLAEFDCTTYVETVLAAARCVTGGNLSPTEFKKNIKWIRYRQGKMAGYESRLHYFSDWIRDNEKKKVLKDVSRRLGGAPHRKKINYMTAHRELYPALKNQTLFTRMQKVEEDLSRKTFYVIPKDEISHVKSDLRQGDLIAFTSSQGGLDIAHAGFAVLKNKQWHLLHASVKEGAVVISKENISAYLKKKKTFSGIMIARFFKS